MKILIVSLFGECDLKKKDESYIYSDVDATIESIAVFER